MSSGGVSSSIWESKRQVFLGNRLFLGDSSRLGWKMTGVCEKAGILGKKAVFLRRSWYFWGNMSRLWEKSGLSWRKCHVFGRKLVYLEETAIFLGVSVILRSVK